MKRRTKIGWLGLLLAMIAAVCAACSIPGVGEVELTKLTAPEIRVEDGVVSWNSVPNASGYIVRINGREDTTAELNYRIASLVSESGEVLVKVKARGSALYAESEWSKEVAYQYIKADPAPGEDMFEELQPYGIGYGYNVITKEYFNIEEREKTAAILDTRALAQTCRLVESKTNQGLSGSLIENSIESISQSTREKFYQSVEASVNFSIFSAGIKHSFQIDSHISKDNYRNQYYYSYYDDQSTYDQYLEYKSLTNLQNALSDTFLTDLSGQSAETSGMTVEERAAFLIQKYGTHLIVGVKLGGKMECTYTILTNEEIDSYELGLHLDSVIKAGMSGKIGGENTQTDGYSLEIAQKLAKSSTWSKFYCSRSGGSSVGTWTLEELGKNYSAWAASFDDLAVSKVVGTSTNGLIALWNLIPEEYMDVRLALKQIFEETGADVYDSFLSDYVSTELKQYTVTFMDEDGMTPLSEVQCYFGTTVPASSVPEKEQYVCTGWYTDPGLTQPFDPLTEGVRKDLTLYGKWEPLTYTVSFAGTDIPDQKVGAAQGFLVQRPADPQLEGRQFLGWYADAEYTAEFDFSKPIVRDTTVYAKWDNDISYEITYVLNGGENAPDNGGVYNILNLPVTLYQPTRFGYDFLGWYFSADFSGDPVTRLEKGLTGDITLHARWEARTSVIRFVNAEGEAPDPITVTYGQAFDLPQPSHRGNAGKHAVYQFEGWYSGSLFDPESWDFTDPATGAFASELTLSAGWTRSPEFASYTLIDSETDFRAIANDLSGKYLLMADIDFAGTSLDPFGTFNGILLGNGHTLKNLKITWTENQTALTVGLFGTNKGTIDGLRLQDPVIKVSPNFVDRDITTYAGTIAGINAGTITDCRVEGLDLLANSHDIAEKFMQQFGKDPRTITQSDKLEWEKWMKQDFSGTLPSHEPNWSDLCLRVYGGGIAGSNEGTIRDVSVSGSVEVNVYNMRGAQTDEAHTHHSFAGGIAGRNSGTITGAVNSARINAYLESDDMSANWLGWVATSYPVGWVYAGGIAGYNFSGQISGCSNSGSLSVKYRVFSPPYIFLTGMDLFGTNKASDANIKRGTNDIAN